MNTVEKTRNMVMTAVMTAIIFVLAFTPMLGYIPLGFMNATTIHIPVIIGAILLGPRAGAFLGAIFGLTSFLKATFITPMLTSFCFTPFYSVSPEFHGNGWSLVVCFVPRILVGVVAYYVYHWMEKIMHGKNNGDIVALGVAGVAGSLINTLLVMNFIYLFFGAQYASASNITGFVYGAILTVIGINGVPEAIVAAILTIAITKILLKAVRR